MLKKTKKDLINLVILSFKYENVFNEGYMKYREWAKRINNVIDVYCHNTTRAIFVNLVKEKIFIKRKINRNITYLFSPYGKEFVDKYEEYDGVVSFD